MPATRSAKRVASSSLKASNLPSSSRTDSPTRLSVGSSMPSITSSAPHTPLFPAAPTPPPKRPSHHKKRPASHIPRPPNAFILFRANFIRDRHMQTSATGPLANVSPTALSTIVGITWRNLPEEERQIWIEKARIAREEHKLLHPSYRYQPLPTAEERAINRENKRKVKEENVTKPDILRCQEISRLLVQGYRGEQLEERIAEFDQNRGQRVQQPGDERSHPAPTRSSSLPTPVPTRQRGGRRPRANSSSETHMLPPNFGYVFEGGDLDSFPSTPELLPAVESDFAMQQPTLASVAEQSLPELIYDAASPSSVILPEPQDGMMQGAWRHEESGHQRTEGDLTYTTLPTSQDQSRSLHGTPNFSDSHSQPYPSLTAWDSGHLSHHDQMYQFPYFSNGYNDSVMTHDARYPHSALTTHTDPYASAIPPFELYHTLKSSEQSFDWFNTPGCAIHATQCEC